VGGGIAARADLAAVDVPADAVGETALDGHRDLVPLAVGHRAVRGVVRVRAIGELQAQAAEIEVEVVAGAGAALVEDRLHVAGGIRAQPGDDREIAGAEAQVETVGNLDVALDAVELEGAADHAGRRGRSALVQAVVLAEVVRGHGRRPPG
jgi:hypothetical protein